MRKSGRRSAKGKRTAAGVLVVIVIMVAGGLLVGPLPGLASAQGTPSWNFSYGYGTPIVPKPVGAQGQQGPGSATVGPNVPASEIGSSGHLGPVNVTSPGTWGSTASSVSLTVYNGTAASHVAAVDQEVALQNVTTGRWVPGTTGSSGTVTLSATEGYWALYANASSQTAFVNYRSQDVVHITATSPAYTIYLLPESDTVKQVDNGPTSATTLIWTYQSELPGITIDLLNGSATGPVIASAVTGSNLTATFTRVSTAYTYWVETIGWNQSLDNLRYFMNNITDGSFAFTTGETTFARQFGNPYAQWASTATITGTAISLPYPGGNNFWSVASNTVISGGTFTVSGGFSMGTGVCVSFVNTVVVWNNSASPGSCLKFENSTLDFVVQPFGLCASSAPCGSIINSPSEFVFHLEHTLVVYGDEPLGLPLGPWVNNSILEDGAVANGGATSIATAALYYINDYIGNLTMGIFPTDLYGSSVENSTVQNNPWHVGGYLTLTTNATRDLFYLSTIQAGAYATNPPAVNFYDDRLVNMLRTALDFAEDSEPLTTGNGTFAYSSVVSQAASRNYTSVFLYPEVTTFRHDLVNISTIGGTDLSILFGQNQTIEYSDFINNYTAATVVSENASGHYGLILNLQLGYEGNDTFQYNTVDVIGNERPNLSGVLEGSDNIIRNNLYPYIGLNVVYVVNRPNLSGTLIENNTYGVGFWNTSMACLFSMPCPGGHVDLSYPNGMTIYYDPSTIPAGLVATHNTFRTMLSGTGTPADFVLEAESTFRQVTISDNLFENNLGTGPSPSHSFTAPFTAAIQDDGVPIAVTGNWFLGLNNLSRAAILFNGQGPGTVFSGNRYFAAPAPAGSYASSTYVPVVTYSSNVTQLTYDIQVNLEGHAASGLSFQDATPITNSSSAASTTGVGDTFDWTVPVDVNVSSGTPVVGYQVGLSAGPEPPFKWDGFNYSEQVGAFQIELGANSSNAPSITASFGGLNVGESYAYTIYNATSGTPVSGPQNNYVYPTIAGYVNLTYNPATMPGLVVFVLDPSNSIGAIAGGEGSFVLLLAAAGGVILLGTAFGAYLVATNRREDGP